MQFRSQWLQQIDIILSGKIRITAVNANIIWGVEWSEYSINLKVKQTEVAFDIAHKN